MIEIDGNGICKEMPGIVSVNTGSGGNDGKDGRLIEIAGKLRFRSMPGISRVKNGIGGRLGSDGRLIEIAGSEKAQREPMAMATLLEPG